MNARSTFNGTHWFSLHFLILFRNYSFWKVVDSEGGFLFGYVPILKASSHDKHKTTNSSWQTINSSQTLLFKSQTASQTIKWWKLATQRLIRGSYRSGMQEELGLPSGRYKFFIGENETENLAKKFWFSSMNLKAAVFSSSVAILYSSSPQMMYNHVKRVRHLIG